LSQSSFKEPDTWNRDKDTLHPRPGSTPLPQIISPGSDNTGFLKETRMKVFKRLDLLSLDIFLQNFYHGINSIGISKDLM
jgi:hypothetical protein